jgi:hypothetical protein
MFKMGFKKKMKKRYWKLFWLVWGPEEFRVEWLRVSKSRCDKEIGGNI